MLSSQSSQASSTTYQDYPRIQLLTIEEPLHGKKVDMPPGFGAFKQVEKARQQTQQHELGLSLVGRTHVTHTVRPGFASAYGRLSCAGRSPMCNRRRNVKGHLASFRKGWESENLARFILYKFAFVAHPSTVSDDIGSDFFCTLFQTERDGDRDYLMPGNSFAIQIKSQRATFDVSDKLDYLSRLEIPFLVGVADRQDLKLVIYSGEYLPLFFSHKGGPKALKIELCERTRLDLDRYCTESGDQDYILRFPKVTEVQADIQPSTLKEVVRTLGELCSITSENIASRRNCEYIFRVSGDSSLVVIFAGSGSAQVFRANFQKRLAEVFFNLKWIYERRKGFNMDEFRAYEELFHRLEGLYGNELPGYLRESVVSLKALVDEGTQREEEDGLVEIGSIWAKPDVA